MQLQESKITVNATVEERKLIKEFTGRYCPVVVSWNHLMQIVDEIEAIEDPHHGHFGVHISSNSCVIQATNLRTDKPLADPPHYFADWTNNTKIDAVWIGIIAFIKWYIATKK
jgi:hypothetical protein